MSSTPIVCLLAALAALSTTATRAAAVYSEDWSGGTAAGWRSNAAMTNSVTHDAAIGQPAGSLRTLLTPSAVSPVLGMHAEDVPALRGDFGGSVWTVSFDLRLDSGQFDNVLLRFRYQDASFGGWGFDFDEVLGQYGVWHALSVTFDADWTDDEAIAAGWVKDPLGAVGFAQTLSNVYWTEVRLEMPSDASFGSAHIDNFQLHRMPVPGSLALALGGLAALGVAARAGRAAR